MEGFADDECAVNVADVERFAPAFKRCDWKLGGAYQSTSFRS
jgi:hypothetical protein